MYQFSLQPDGISQGKLWLLLTHGLLHGALWHLGLNVLALWMLGRQAAWEMGHAHLLRVLVLGILGGGVFHLLYCSISGQNFPLVGISGGLCGILGLLTCVSPDSKMWPLPVSGKNAWLGFSLASVVLLLIDPALKVPIISVAGSRIDTALAGQLFILAHACHLGGLVVGWCYGKWCLRERVSLATLQRQRERNERKVRSVE